MAALVETQSELILNSTNELTPAGVGFDTPVTRFNWTLEKYCKLAEDGFFEGQRVELIEGEIFVMAPMNTPHATALRLVQHELQALIHGKALLLDIQMPLRIQASELEPDLAVRRGTPRDHVTKHPQNAELVVEVSDTSVRHDRQIKTLLYAAAGIPEFWIVNLSLRQLEVYRAPAKDDASRTGYYYSSLLTFGAKETVSPLFASDAVVRVGDLLP